MRQHIQYLQCFLPLVKNARIEKILPTTTLYSIINIICVSDPNPRGNVSIKRWGHGNYTLVRDDCVETTSALDAHLFINVPKGWTQEHGGFVSYIAKNEDEEVRHDRL